MNMASTIRHCGWAAPVLVMLAVPARGDSFPDSLPPPPPGPALSTAVIMAEKFQNFDAWRPDRDSVWSVSGHVLHAQLPNQKQAHSFAFAGANEWEDYAVDLDVLQLRGVDKGVAVRVQGENGIGVDLRGGEYQDVLLYRRELPLGHAKAPNQDLHWHHLRVEARGNRYSVLVDGKLVLTGHDKLPGYRHGRIALPAYSGGLGLCSVCYANVVVTTLANKP
jgi:hypothetical protein